MKTSNITIQAELTKTLSSDFEKGKFQDFWSAINSALLKEESSEEESSEEESSEEESSEEKSSEEKSSEEKSSEEKSSEEKSSEEKSSEEKSSEEKSPEEKSPEEKSSEEKSSEEKLKNIKDKFKYRLAKKLKSALIEKAVSEQSYRQLFLEIVKIEDESEKMTLDISVANSFFDTLNIDIDLFKLVLARCISNIFSNSLNLSQEKVERSINWSVEVPEETKRYIKKSNTSKDFYSLSKLLLQGSAILFRIAIVLISAHASNLFNESVQIQEERNTLNRKAIEEEVLKIKHEPLQIIIEGDGFGCSCGLCNRCLPNCSPC